MAVNQFKTDDTKTKKKSKKSTSKKEGIFSKISSPVISFYKNEKLAKTVGLSLFVFSIFLLLAFSSFLFTWKVDQDIINHHWSNPEIQVENWLGKIGAYVAHQFIYNGFGISSFLFVLLSFILGFRILFKITLLPLGKSFRYASFSIIWLSILFGFLFQNHPILGGTFGFQSNLWLNSIMGGIGISLLLVLSILLFLVFNFNISFNFFSRKEKNEDETLSTIEGIYPSENDVEIEENEVPVAEGEDDENTLSLTVDEAPEEEKEEEEAVELSTTTPPVADKTGEDIEFSVEEATPKDEILSDDKVNSKVEDFGEYDPTLDLSSYQLPSIELLKEFGDTQQTVTKEELEANKNRILDTLENYNIKNYQHKSYYWPYCYLI